MPASGVVRAIGILGSVTALFLATPAPAGSDTTQSLLDRADAAGAAANYREADSLARRAMDRMRASPPRTESERLALVDGIVAWARLNTDAGCDTIAAWARWAADRHDGERRGSRREQAWRMSGRAYQRAGRMDSASVCYARSVAAMRARGDRKPDDAARLLAMIAMQYLAAERSQDMFRYAEEAVAEWRGVPGADSLILATALVPRARVRLERSQIDSTRTDLAVALGVRLRMLGPDHGDLVWVWRTIATLRALSDDLPGARTAVEEAVRIAVRTRPEGDAELIHVFSQAGSVCGAAGDVVEACRYGRAAAAAALARYGRSHATTASCRIALANSLSHLGDLASALDEAREAVEIQREILPEMSGGRAYGLSTLGNIELEAGHSAEAYDHFRESARIREAMLGPDHMLVAYSLGGQAAAAEGIGRIDEALALLDRVARTQESRGLLKQLVETWNALGRLQHRVGRDSLALVTLDRSVAAGDSIFGTASAAARTPRLLRLPVLSSMGQDREAIDEALILATIERTQTWEWIESVSEREGLAAAESRSAALSAALEISAESARGGAPLRAVWDELTRSRALAYQVQAARRYRRTQPSPDAAAALTRLDSARAVLAREMVASMRSVPPADRSRLDSLRRGVEEAERRAAEAAPATGQRFRSVGIDEVLAMLQPTERLLAFARFERMEAESGGGGSKRAFAYLAFIGERDAPVRLLALGDAAALDERVGRWHALVRRPAHDAAGEAALERRTIEAGQSVRRGFWDPVAAHLKGATRVYLVPDGSVANVDFAALALPDGTYLAETEPLIVPLSCERDLIPIPHDGRGLLALGAPDFNAGLGAAAGDAAVRGAATAPDSTRLGFDSLPESGEEARETAAAWTGSGREDSDAWAMTDTMASERALRERGASRAMLHLATHGFLLDGSLAPERGSSRRGVAALAVEPSASRPLAGSVDWSLTGLALAGANLPDGATTSSDDGFLTGTEIADLDLSRVRCAVLSACRPGTGQSGRFESIQGLERAFRLAGVGQVVMSLWPVADADARAWVRAFYDGYLNRKLSVPEAVRVADVKRLRALRSQGDHPRPDRWAPFFVRGERP